MDSSKKSILKTLAYSDVFDYPLTKEEIWKYLISPGKISKKEFEKSLQNVSSKDKFYCLPNRSQIIDKRKIREKESLRKLKLAKKISSVLSIVPTVCLIGVSGGVSMRNADKDDDIDLFIISQKNTLWLTRLFLLIFLEVLGRRRKRSDKNVNDKICLNMLIDETAIKLSLEKRNLYTAHEIVQMIPLFEREDIYSRFVIANSWVKRYLPNVLNHGTKLNIAQNNTKSFFSMVLRPVLRFSTLEYLARKIQLLSIKRHQTTEVISDHLLAFHPKDCQKFVLREYNKRLRRYRI